MVFLVLGPTGLIVERKLLAGPAVTRVIAISRRQLSIQDPRLEVAIVDFEQRETWEKDLRGDVLVSALGTDPDSPFFYLRMKGQLEATVTRLPFASIAILRPGSLTWPRKTRRPGKSSPRFS
jgi:hypothetical protein